MSKALLEYLNSSYSASFQGVIDALGPDPNIVWYPSAGKDFMPLMYLSSVFAEKKGLPVPKELEPDIFIFSDCGNVWAPGPKLFHMPILHQDRHTKMWILELEQLPSKVLPVDFEILGHPFTERTFIGEIYYLRIRIESDMLGVLEYPVLYVFNGNEVFCSKILLPLKARISHVVHKRYGAGYSTGKSTGVWILRVVKKLNTSYFIVHDWWKGYVDEGDAAAYDTYRNLRGAECTLREIGKIEEPPLYYCAVE